MIYFLVFVIYLLTSFKLCLYLGRVLKKNGEQYNRFISEYNQKGLNDENL